jgi:hypothetical protein
MTRRLSTLLLSLAFLLSVVHLDNAQPLDNSSSDHKLDAGEASPVPVVPQNNNPSLNRLDRPASLAGEPKWMTSNIIPKPKHEPKDQSPPHVSAHDGQVAPCKPTNSRQPNPTRPTRDVVALFADRKHTLIIRYRRSAGRDLYITDGHRTERQQAIAIRKNLRLYGTRHVIVLYRSSPAIREIVQAYRLNRRSGRSISAMTRVIEKQVSQGIFISNHMRWRAVDVRSRGWHRARLSVLQQVAQSMGARVSVEPNHYHVDLL